MPSAASNPRHRPPERDSGGDGAADGLGGAGECPEALRAAQAAGLERAYFYRKLKQLQIKD